LLEDGKIYRNQGIAALVLADSCIQKVVKGFGFPASFANWRAHHCGQISLLFPDLVQRVPGQAARVETETLI
jgi:hypothetical protein